MLPTVNVIGKSKLLQERVLSQVNLINIISNMAVVGTIVVIKTIQQATDGQHFSTLLYIFKFISKDVFFLQLNSTSTSEFSLHRIH